jgi:cyclic beta-1,2-glucan synthetase
MGTGDWNDGMNRVGEKGQGESVWLGWFLYAALTLRAAGRGAGRDRARRAWRAHADALKARSSARPGTAIGTGAPISTTARRSGRPQRRVPDRFHRAVLGGALRRGDPPGRAARAMAAVERELIRPRRSAWRCCSRRRSTRRRSIPATSRAIRRASARTAASTRMPRLWSVMAFAALGEGDKAAALFAMLNPINHARTRADVHRYKVEPYVIAADIYSTAPHVGRGGWTWYTGSAGWMQRAGVESMLGLRLRRG